MSTYTVSITDDPAATRVELASLPEQRGVTLLGLDGARAYVENQSTHGYVPLYTLAAQ